MEGFARDFVQIKSDRLNYEDFIAGDRTFTIEKIGKRNDQGKDRLLIFFKEEPTKAYWPSLGMVKCLANAEGGWGDAPFAEWIGRQIRLFGDPHAMYAGKELGGIRISHISHISSPYITKITERRGVRIDFNIDPLELLAYPQEDFDKNLPAWNKAVVDGKMTAEQVIARAEQKGKLTDAQKALIGGGK